METDGYLLKENVFELRQMLKGLRGSQANIGKTEYFRAMVLDISVPEFQLGSPGRLFEQFLSS